MGCSKIYIIAMLLSALAACGGGGDGGNAKPAPEGLLGITLPGTSSAANFSSSSSSSGDFSSSNSSSTSTSTSSNSSSGRIDVVATFYETYIEGPVVQRNENAAQLTCVICHVDGGLATDSNLVFVAGEEIAFYNQRVLESYVDGNSANIDYVLSKVRGEQEHTGAEVFSTTDEEYQNLETYFSLLYASLSDIDSASSTSTSTSSSAGSSSSTSASSSASNSSSSSSSSSSTGVVIVDPPVFYAKNLEEQVVQTKCVNCHIAGGVSAGTRLVFTDGPNIPEINYPIFEEFIETIEGGATLMLDKVRGVDHGGALQFASDSEEYLNLEAFLGVVGSSSSNNGEFFDGISKTDTEATLRRAALILAGRMPTLIEIVTARPSESALRTTIRGLMKGDGFHDFLINGANDRLLTDAFLNGLFPDILDGNAGYYRRLAKKKYDMISIGQEAEYWEWHRGFTYGIVRAPLELIAFIVKNDRRYWEVLTADYMMVNPQVNEIFDGGAVFFSEDPTQFNRGENNGQILLNDLFEAEYVEGIGLRIDAAGGYVNYPHAGILNEPAFLNRYPSTSTNRNRARARWTYYHFLDVDIEKSATRTTDPAALADTNNPTLNNPSCTVCHQVMDPVAGTFQNYGDEGWYRSSWGGENSLPDVYKLMEETLFEPGDTWYRDMLEPGFNTVLAPDNRNSLQWLAQQIIEDPGFGRATVKFWWGAVMAEKLLSAPENSSDPNFNAKQRAYEQQTTFINELGDSFIAGFNGGNPYNLKDLLLEMIMSDWFRAETTGTPLSDERKLELAGVGVGRLLTPRELQAKTTSLTGITWGLEEDNTWEVDGQWTELENRFRIYYGGIDSRGITERAKELNTLMSNVALAQAINVACPTVIFDFNRTDEEKLLFTEVDRNITPVSQISEQFEVVGDSNENRSVHILSGALSAGPQVVNISFDNPYWDAEANESTLLVIHRLEVRNDQGAWVARIGGEELETMLGFVAPTGDAGNITGTTYWDEDVSELTGYMLWAGTMGVPMTILEDGNYTIRVEASRVNLPEQQVLMSIGLTGSNPRSNTAGEQAIRRQLQLLHEKLLGEVLEVDSTEIEESYDLLVDIWEERQDDNVERQAFDSATETCNIPIENWWDQDWTEEFADPQYMQGTWIAMMIYFLTDFRYLHE